MESTGFRGGFAAKERAFGTLTVEKAAEIVKNSHIRSSSEILRACDFLSRRPDAELGKAGITKQGVLERRSETVRLLELAQTNVAVSASGAKVFRNYLAVMRELRKRTSTTSPNTFKLLY